MNLTASLYNALPSEGVPSEICYFPEGRHTIYPGSHPEGIEVNLPREQGIAIAARLDAELKERLKASVKPWIDFEHTGRFPSGGRPIAFRYQDGAGIMCAMDWSRSGKEAIEGKDVNYFSPRVDLDENRMPKSLPKRGPLGGLVTEPAFRDGMALTASSATIGNDFLTLADEMVQAGEAQSQSEAFTLLANENPGLYDKYHNSLIAAENSSIPGWVKRDLEQMRCDTKLSPKEELQALAENLLNSGKAKDEDDAMVKACEQRPELYEQWIRNGAEMLSYDPLEAMDQSQRVTELHKRASLLVASGDASSYSSALECVCQANPSLYDAYCLSLHGR